MMIKQSLLVSLVSLCAGLWMAGCASSKDSAGVITDNLKGGQSAQHREDASDNDNDQNKDGGGMALGNGNGAHNGMGTGDGKDCKPTDGGPSPCARGDGGNDDNGDADDNEQEDGDDMGNDDGGPQGKCASLDGGPSPCSEGHEQAGGRDH